MKKIALILSFSFLVILLSCSNTNESLETVNIKETTNTNIEERFPESIASNNLALKNLFLDYYNKEVSSTEQKRLSKENITLFDDNKVEIAATELYKLNANLKDKTVLKIANQIFFTPNFLEDNGSNSNILSIEERKLFMMMMNNTFTELNKKKSKGRKKIQIQNIELIMSHLSK